MISVDQENLETVLAAEAGQHRAMELISGGIADLGHCLRPTGDQRDPSWYPYFPAVLQELYDKATNTEVPVLDALSVRAGLVWVCGTCNWRNPHWFDSCAVAH